MHLGGNEKVSSYLQTKKSLAKSLKKLMRLTPLHKISVKDVVKDCNLNRQTFYYHFHDIYELVEWIYKTEAIESIAEYKSYNTWIDGFYKIFLYIEGNKEFCYNTLNSLSRTHLDMYLFSVINGLLMGVINEISSDMIIKIEDKKFMADFYTHAFAGLVIQWMKDGMKEDPKVLIEKLKELIEGNFVIALKRYQQMI